MFYIIGKSIVYVNQYSHLGHIISADLNDKSDIMHRRSATVNQINNVLCYYRQLDNIVTLKLLKAYCSSLYGCVLWDSSHCCIESLCSAWRIGLRRVLGLPHNTHCFLLLPLTCTLPLIDEMFKRFVFFLLNVVYLAIVV